MFSTEGKNHDDRKIIVGWRETLKSSHFFMFDVSDVGRDTRRERGRDEENHAVIASRAATN